MVLEVTNQLHPVMVMRDMGTGTRHGSRVVTDMRRMVVVVMMRDRILFRFFNDTPSFSCLVLMDMRSLLLFGFPFSCLNPFLLHGQRTVYLK